MHILYTYNLYSLGDVLPDGSVFLFVKSVDESDTLYRHYHTSAPLATPTASTPATPVPTHNHRVDIEGGFLFKPLAITTGSAHEADLESDPVDRPGISAEIAFRFDPNLSCCPEWV